LATLAEEAALVIRALDAAGRWTEDGRIRAATFSRNMAILGAYVSLAERRTAKGWQLLLAQSLHEPPKIP
jgi:hypothetical protein